MHFLSSPRLLLVCLLTLGLIGAIALRTSAAQDTPPDSEANSAEDAPSSAEEDSPPSVDSARSGEANDQETGDPSPPKSSGKYNALLASLTIFVLAVFVGFEVITKVPPTLHTPLMSGSNAISGITIVGAILATGFGGNWLVSFVGMIALALAAINVVGGFLVTHRMLEMFRKKK